MRPETREPGSSRTPAGVVVGNRPLAGARWRDRRSAPQRGFCSRKRTNVCGRRSVGLFARASLSILSSAAPLFVVRALSRADSGRRGGTEGRGRGRTMSAGTAKGTTPKDGASWQPPAASAQTSGKLSSATSTSTEGATWICSSCSVPWTRTSLPADASFTSRPGTACTILWTSTSRASSMSGSPTSRLGIRPPPRRSTDKRCSSPGPAGRHARGGVPIR